MRDAARCHVSGRRHIMTFASAVAATLVGGMAAHPARSETAKEFFEKTKQISLVIGYEPGGTYDSYARMIATYMPKYLPGQTTIVTRNMPGAGSLRAANFLYSQAPRDGATLGAISQALVLNQAFKYPGVEFNLEKFNWVGRLAPSVEMTVAWNPSKVKTIEDVKKNEFIVGAASASGSSAGLPRVMNSVLGTKFKIIPGYGGMGPIALAMERGEVQGGHATTNKLLTDSPDWLTDNKVTVLVQYSQDRHPKFSDVPTMVELGSTAEEKQVLSIFGSMADIGRTLVAPPEIAADRVALLRQAFEAMIADKSFLTEIAKRNLEFEPMPGEMLQSRIRTTFDISQELAARAAAAWEGKAEP